MVKRYQHILCIGTTGMLAEATRVLAHCSDRLTITAGTEASLSKLGQTLDAKVSYYPVALDYHDTQRLEAAVQDALRRTPVDLVLAWIHSSAPDSAPLIAEQVAAGSEQPEFYHVLGSAAAAPDAKAAELARQFEQPGLSYHQVVLGVELEGSSSRWLTDEEISEGVLKAITQKRPRYVVGTLEPWSAKP